MEYYTAVRMNELKLYVTTCMNLTNMMASEENQAQMSTDHMIPFIES